MELFLKGILPLIVLVVGGYFLRKYLKSRKKSGTHGTPGGGGGGPKPK
jgi:predicted permease